MPGLWIRFPRTGTGKKVWNVFPHYCKSLWIRASAKLLKSKCVEMLRPIVVPFIHCRHLMFQHDCARPVSQGSVHNSWKLKMSQFIHSLYTHQTCHSLSMFGMLWIDVYDSMFQFMLISSNFAHPLKSSGTTFRRPQPTAWSTLCEGDVTLHEANGGH